MSEDPWILELWMDGRGPIQSKKLMVSIAGFTFALNFVQLLKHNEPEKSLRLGPSSLKDLFHYKEQLEAERKVKRWDPIHKRDVPLREVISRHHKYDTSRQRRWNEMQRRRKALSSFSDPMLYRDEIPDFSPEARVPKKEEK